MNETTLRGYLLGRLPENEAARVEELALQDEEVFETLRGIEDDLFDEHAGNGSSSADRERFLQRYGGQHERLAFARALAARSGGARVQPFSRSRWLAGLAAAAMLVLAVGALLVTRDQPAETPVAGPPAVQPAPAVSVPAVAVAIALGTSRASTQGGPVVVTVPTPAGNVDLRVRLDPAERFDRYALELRSTANTIAWRADDVRAVLENGELVVRGVVPASSLATGSYELAVRGGRGGAPVEDVGFATLEVRKTP